MSMCCDGVTVQSQKGLQKQSCTVFEGKHQRMPGDVGQGGGVYSGSMNLWVVNVKIIL